MDIMTLIWIIRFMCVVPLDFEARKEKKKKVPNTSSRCSPQADMNIATRVSTCSSNL